MFDRGAAIIGHTSVHNRQCLKFTCLNPTITESQMEGLVRLVVDEGKKIEAELG